MRPKLHFEQIQTTEQFGRMAEFAASFDHKIDDTTLTPLFAVRRGDKLFGYFSVIQEPIYLPSFHPEHTSKRDFFETVREVTKRQYAASIGNERFPNGMCYCAFSNPDVSRELLRKTGWRSTKCELFESFPELAEVT